MAVFYSRIHLAFPIALLSILLFPAVGSAQRIDINGMPYETEEETHGCSRLEELMPLPTAKVVSCQKGDSVEISLPLQPDANGALKEKKVRGAYQFREYQVGEIEEPSAFDHLLAALPMAGFRVKYSNKPSTITARKDDIWILIHVSDDLYNVSVIREIPDNWRTVQTAEEIASEIQAHGRVDIYGIEFSPSDQSIVESTSKILSQVLKYLKQNPDVSIIIESDKVSPTGTPEDDAEITRERANAVMDWLVAHGVPKSRVQPLPAGRNNPITDNESPAEIQRNERIVLIKAAS